MRITISAIMISLLCGCSAASAEPEDSMKALKALEKETGIPAEKLLPKIEKLLDSRFKELLKEYNEMASNNFSVALKLFRDDYAAKRIRIFGEVDKRSTFNIDDYHFVVIPTVAEKNPGQFNPEHCNMASHANGMVVMLACKWSMEEDKRGGALLEKLKKFIPKYNLSDPKHGNLPITDLKEDSDMMKSEAEQWRWRMNDLPQK